jgi:hypothetical protein
VVGYEFGKFDRIAGQGINSENDFAEAVALGDRV